MASEGKNASGLESFKGKGYAMWKDKLLTHINTQDQLHKRKQLEKGLPEVLVLMADFLRGSPGKPPAIPEQSQLSEKDTLTMRWAMMDWERAKGDLQNLLNQVLPNFFLSTLPDLVSQMEPCEVIKALEKDNGQGDAAGLIELTRAWSKLAKMSRVEVLSQLPSEFWASSISIKKGEFTVEKVESALRRIFAEKSKKEISGNMEKGSGISINNVRANPAQKRKHAPKTENECFYCFETGHYKADCLVMARDRDPNREGGQLFRTNVKTAPGANKKACKSSRRSIR
ncbi:hypothetical protein PR001_g203 [Phytophthora rubi]|uniref:CCHC-type domain-containing protein n=1 Tax=Phytophthora rubi TaxID=129364 RepID=A0A6A3PE50_9STRA|nr:hypothetical protein PR001_g203 [Phytophthora rubi]